MKIFSNRLITIYARKWLKRSLSANSPAIINKDSDEKTKESSAVALGSQGSGPRVVIIGAGVAGLSAAAHLAQNGVTDIVLLESQRRIGGRIRSRWLTDVVVELGSDWQSRNAPTHPVYEMAADEEPPKPGVPGAMHARGLFDPIDSGKLELAPAISAYHKFKQIEQEAEQMWNMGGSKQKGTIIEFIGFRIQQELSAYSGQQRQNASRLMFGLAHTRYGRSVTDTAFIDEDDLACFMRIPNGDVCVPMGMAATLDPIVRQIPAGVIRCGKTVKCIYWGTAQKTGPRANVITDDEAEFPADFVIITVPLGVLQKNICNMFCPHLPSYKTESILCLPVYHCNKIYAQYEQPFWYWNEGLLCYKYSRQELCDRGDWTRGVASLELVPNSKYVLCAVVKGPEAAIMEGLEDKDVIAGFTSVLQMSTGDETVPSPRSVLRSAWSKDPSFCGAYSCEYFDSDGKSQNALASPLPGPGEPILPILLFAGEATAPGFHGTVEGARFSGLREADRVLKLARELKKTLSPLVPVQQEKSDKEAKAN